MSWGGGKGPRVLPHHGVLALVDLKHPRMVKDVHGGMIEEEFHPQEVQGWMGPVLDPSPPGATEAAEDLGELDVGCEGQRIVAAHVLQAEEGRRVRGQARPQAAHPIALGPLPYELQGRSRGIEAQGRRAGDPGLEEGNPGDDQEKAQQERYPPSRRGRGDHHDSEELRGPPGGEARRGYRIPGGEDLEEHRQREGGG